MYNCIPGSGGQSHFKSDYLPKDEKGTSLDVKIWPMIARTVGLIGIAAIAVAGIKCAQEMQCNKKEPNKPYQQTYVPAENNYR